MLFTEVVSRTFTDGVLKGITIEERIVRVAHPRAVGARQVVAKPIAGSPYVDTVVGVEQ